VKALAYQLAIHGAFLYMPVCVLLAVEWLTRKPTQRDTREETP
jgi:hypothetical protein